MLRAQVATGGEKNIPINSPPPPSLGGLLFSDGSGSDYTEKRSIKEMRMLQFSQKELHNQQRKEEIASSLQHKK